MRKFKSLQTQTISDSYIIANITPCQKFPVLLGANIIFLIINIPYGYGCLVFVF